MSTAVSGLMEVKVSSTRKTLIYIMIIFPALAFLIGPWLATRGFRPVDILILAVLYPPIAFGVTGGLHRFFTHASFKTTRTIKIILGVFALMALEGEIKTWVADHLHHHKYSDTEDDLHSPMRGFAHAHFGWFFGTKKGNPEVYCKRLLRDSDIAFLDKAWPLIALVTIFGPLAFGWEAFVWGLVRIFLIHHVTWSINSLCHMIGTHPRDTGDNSRNIWWLAWISFGESWHNFHHWVSGLARHGTAWWNDFTYASICVLEYFKLAWDVKR